MRSSFAFLPVCAVLAVFAVPAFAQNNDMRGVMSRLDQMQRQVDLISRQVYKGDVPASAIKGGSAVSGDTANLAAAMDERLAGLEASIHQLNNRIDEQNYAFGQLKQDFDIFKSDTEVRLNETAQSSTTGSSFTSSDNTPVDTNRETEAMATETSNASAGAGDTQDLPSNSAAALYDASFQALREQKYERAEAGFQKFLNEYGSDALAGNAQYWLGETFYVRGNYAEAAKVFATGYQKFPQSGKAPDNLLKLGLSLAQAGKKEDACVTLQQLRKQYSNAAAVIKQRAEDEQKKLNCGITG